MILFIYKVKIYPKYKSLMVQHLAYYFMKQVARLVCPKHCIITQALGPFFLASLM